MRTAFASSTTAPASMLRTASCNASCRSLRWIWKYGAPCRCSCGSPSGRRCSSSPVSKRRNSNAFGRTAVGSILGTQAQVVEHLDRVGAHLHARAHLAELRRPLVDTHPVSASQQRGRGGQAADARADDRRCPSGQRLSRRRAAQGGSAPRGGSAAAKPRAWGRPFQPPPSRLKAAEGLAGAWTRCLFAIHKSAPKACAARPLASPVTIGEHIRAKRRERQLLQRDVAVRIGVTAETISHWEKHGTTPPVSLMPWRSSVSWDMTPTRSQRNCRSACGNTAESMD